MEESESVSEWVSRPEAMRSPRGNAAVPGCEFRHRPGACPSFHFVVHLGTPKGEPIRPNPGKSNQKKFMKVRPKFSHELNTDGGDGTGDTTIVCQSLCL